MKKTSVFSNGVLWFGAAISIAEIEAGCSIGGNWTALIAGHLFGGFMLYAAGLLGATSGKNAMETTTATFGRFGMRMFAVLNIVQLVGWTAVMIAQGGAAVSQLTSLPYTLPCLALAILIGVWIFVAFGDRFHLATIAMGALALMAVVLSVRLVWLAPSATPPSLGFWPAFEISVAMPLSWLPLIADYTSTAARPRLSTAVSAGVYTLASMWMYALGILLGRMGANTVAEGIVAAGLGSIGLVVIVFSTVTTTFLDAYSSGESARSIVAKTNSRLIGVIVCAIGGALAIGGVMDHYINFLYLISSVFAPMSAVLLVDRYLLKTGSTKWNLLAWLVGFIVYQFAGSSPIGPTFFAFSASILVAISPRFKFVAHKRRGI